MKKLLRARLTWIAAGILLALGLFAWGVRAVGRTVASEPGYALARAPFAMAQLPGYLSPAILGDLHRTHIAPLAGSAVDRDAAARVGAALASSPWVRSVASVEIDAEPRVSVALEFREPVARVAWGRGTGLVDAEGILLPSGHYRPESVSAVPLVVGVRKAPPARAGQAWADPGLEAGLEILGRFRSEVPIRNNPAAALATLDVSNVGERKGELPEVVCMTRRRLALRFSMCGRPGRPELDEQVARFKQVLAVDTRLELPRSYVDLRFSRPVGS